MKTGIVIAAAFSLVLIAGCATSHSLRLCDENVPKQDTCTIVTHQWIENLSLRNKAQTFATNLPLRINGKRIEEIYVIPDEYTITAIMDPHVVATFAGPIVGMAVGSNEGTFEISCVLKTKPGARYELLPATGKNGWVLTVKDRVFSFGKGAQEPGSEKTRRLR